MLIHVSLDTGLFYSGRGSNGQAQWRRLQDVSPGVLKASDEWLRKTTTGMGPGNRCEIDGERCIIVEI